MSPSELLCLKWNNHTSAFDKLLNSLHLTDMYSDGTIVCHGKFYPVHRFVLSTCSEYFEEIFCQSINLKSKHPYIIVKDIHPLQMEALLNYMYRGEVNVPQEMLPELIKAAEAFKIKGLAVSDDEPPSKSSSSRDRKRSSANLSSPSSQVKRSKRVDDSSKSDKNIIHFEELQTECSESSRSKNYSSSSSQKETDDLFIPEISPNEVKSEPTDLPEYSESSKIPDQNAPSEENYLSPKELGIKEEKSFESYPSAEPLPPFEDDKNFPSDDQYDLAQSSSWDNSQGFEGDGNLEENESARGVEGFAPRLSSCRTSNLTSSNVSLLPYVELMVSNKKVFKCSSCPYRSTLKGNIKKHGFTHTREKPYKCSQCSFRCSLKENMKKHLVTHSGDKPFHCYHCSFKTCHKVSFQNHSVLHSGKKPFNCSLCSYSAILKANLLYHIKKQH